MLKNAVEITIQKNGDLIIPRIKSSENQLISNILKDIAFDGLTCFIDAADESELIFGDQFLCG